MHIRTLISETIVAMAVICFIVIFTAGICRAGQIYRYTNASGIVCFTDNIAEVPESRRREAHSLATASTETVAQQAEHKTGTAAGQQAAGADQKTDPIQEEPADETAVASLRNRLTKLKSELDDSYNNLMNAKTELLSQKDTLSVESYNQQVQRLNAQVSAYENSRRAFQTEAQHFNDLASR